MNATSYQPGTEGGQREWLDGMLTIVEPQETPFVSSVKKQGGAKGVFHETVAGSLDGVKINGTREGDSGTKGANKAKNRQRFGHYLGRYHRPFSVTDVQQAISRNGGEATTSNEYADNKATAIVELKRDLEAACLSSLDCASGGDDSVMRMRGAFSWLSATQTPQVPAAFLNPAAQRLTGQSALTESGSNSLTSVLQSLFNTCGARRSYDGYIGSTYMLNVANFTRTGPETASSGTRVVFDGESAKTIRLNVEMFDTPFGVVAFIPSTFLRISADNGTGDQTALLLIQREFWQLDFLEELHAVDDDEDAGGKSGYVKCIGGLGCRMPKGNGFIYNS